MAILNHGSTLRTADGGQTTTTIVTAANIGTYGVATNSTYYVGTTQNIFNRASGAQTLTGVSIDGSSASCTGNSATATILQTARNINGTSFNGSAAITTANWGTARTLTIGSTGKSVDGSAAVSWSLAELGAAATNQTMFVGTTSVAINRASASQTLTGVSIDGSAATVTTNANLTGHITSVGNATSLGSFTSANLLAALTDETGTGANVFATSPTLVSPALGTPSSGNLANCTFPTLNQNTTGTSSNITAYTINQSVGTTNSPTFAGVTANGYYPSAGITESDIYAQSLSINAYHHGDSLTYDTFQFNAASIYETRATVAASFVSGAVGTSIFKGDRFGAMTIANTVYQARWTWSNTIGYKFFKTLYIANSTNGNSFTVTIESSGNGTTWTTIATSTAMSNWPGHSWYNYVWNNNATQGYIRITVTPTWVNAYGIDIYSMRYFCSYSLDASVRLYDWDYSRNITFPAGLTVTNTITGSVSGNAATATILATGRLIGGVSFNGSADITLPGVNTGGTQNTTGTSSNITAYTINQSVGSTNSPTFATLQLTRLNFGADNAQPWTVGAGGTAGTGLTFGGDYTSSQAYKIFTAMENVGGNYSKLTLNWHTGIRIGAYYGYGGTRFYNNLVGEGTEIFSVGNTDSNVRVVNSLIVNGITINQERAANARMYGAATGAFGLLGVDSAAAFRWQIYGESGNYGFLDSTWGNWDIRKAVNGELDLRVSSALVRVLNAGNYGGYSTFTGVGTFQSNGTQLTLKTSSGPTSYFSNIGSRYDSTHPFTIEVANGAATATEYFGIYADAGGVSNRIALLNGNVGIGTTSPGTKLDVVGAVTMPVIKQSTTLYAGTDITDDDSTRTVYFNIPPGGYSPAKYFKVARIKITGNYQNVSLNGYFTAVSSGVHVGSERKVEFDFIAYAATNAGAPTVTYLKRGPDTTNVLVYAVANGGGAGTTYYDVYIKSAWYNDTNGELAIRVGYGSAVTVWQAGLDSGTSAPVDTLVNANSNYAFDTTGNVGIGAATPAYKLDVSGTGRFTGDLTVTNILGSSNSATLYPNTGSYGSWKIGGTRNGWYGIEFESSSNLMMNSNEVGFHRNGHGWQFWWSAGTAYCMKGNPGGGTQATILDSSNVATYALPIGGGTITGNRPLTIDSGGGGIYIKGDTGGWGMGYYFNGSSGTYKGGFGALGGGDSLTNFWVGPAYNNTWMTFSSSANNSQVALQQGGNQVLHAGNYNSYALPLTGGTLSGALNGTTGTFSSDLSSVGNYQIRNGDPTITFRDTDHRTAYIHVNSNIFHILSGVADSVFGNWNIVANGRWPLEINLSNNNATFGADVNAISFTGSGSGLTGTAASLTVGAVPWSGITSKPTTFSGYGISDLIYGSTSSRNVWTITNWNQTTYPNAHFLSSEGNTTNAPSTDFIYGLQTAFHRDGASYRTQMVSELYSSPVSIWVRNSRDSDVWTAWSKLLHSNNYSSYALPLGGGTLTGALNGTTASFSGTVDATQFRDSSDVAYFLDPAGTSNLNKLSTLTMSYNDMNSMHTQSPYVARYNQGAQYRNGTMGSGNTDCNVMFSNWGSGFIDSWSSPANGPGGSSHYVGLQAFHYNHQNSVNAYGFQMLCAGEADNRFFWRSAWPTLRSWVEMIHSGNITANVLATSGTAANLSIGGSSNNSGSLYSDTGNVGGSRLQYWQAANNATLNPDAEWYNAIRMGHGDPVTYYSNTLAVKMTGSNLGDIYTRTTTNGTAGTWNRFWNNNNDGSGSGLDADLLDGYNSATANTANTIVLRDASGNFSANIVDATQFRDSNNVAYYLDPASTSILNRINLNTAATACIQWRSAGQGTISLGLPFYNNVSYGSINIEVSDNDTGGLVIDNEGVTVYGAGDNGEVFRVIDEDVYQATSNLIASRTFWVNQLQNGGGGILGPFSISGTATASSFTGAGTGLTGTAASLTIGGNAANVTGTVAIANGGTGATTLAAAKANLGITTAETSLTQSLSGTTGCTIDVAAASVHILTLSSGAVISSFTYNNRKASPSVDTLLVVLKFAGTATITWSNVVWASGVTPTLTGVNGKADAYMLTSYKGGAATPVWIGTVVSQNLDSTNL